MVIVTDPIKPFSPPKKIKNEIFSTGVNPRKKIGIALRQSDEPAIFSPDFKSERLQDYDPNFILKSRNVTDISFDPRYIDKIAEGKLVEALREELSIWRLRASKAENLLSIKMEQTATFESNICFKCGGNAFNDLRNESNASIKFWKESYSDLERLIKLERSSHKAAIENSLMENATLQAALRYQNTEDEAIIRMHRSKFDDLMSEIKNRHAQVKDRLLKKESALEESRKQTERKEKEVHRLLALVSLIRADLLSFQKLSLHEKGFKDGLNILLSKIISNTMHFDADHKNAELQSQSLQLALNLNSTKNFDSRTQIAGSWRSSPERGGAVLHDEILPTPLLDNDDLIEWSPRDKKPDVPTLEAISASPHSLAGPPELDANLMTSKLLDVMHLLASQMASSRNASPVASPMGPSVQILMDQLLDKTSAPSDASDHSNRLNVNNIIGKNRALNEIEASSNMSPEYTNVRSSLVSSESKSINDELKNLWKSRGLEGRDNDENSSSHPSRNGESVSINLQLSTRQTDSFIVPSLQSHLLATIPEGEIESSDEDDNRRLAGTLITAIIEKQLDEKGQIKDSKIDPKYLQLFGGLSEDNQSKISEIKPKGTPPIEKRKKESAVSLPTSSRVSEEWNGDAPSSDDPDLHIFLPENDN